MVVINAAGLGDRVFEVFPGAQLNLSGLLITGGRTRGGNYGYAQTKPGGAIYNMGNLSLADCIISNNASGDGNAVQGNGGGTDGGDAGGIFNSGTLTMDHCTISDNSSGAGEDGAWGGNGG